MMYEKNLFEKIEKNKKIKNIKISIAFFIMPVFFISMFIGSCRSGSQVEGYGAAHSGYPLYNHLVRFDLTSSGISKVATKIVKKHIAFLEDQVTKIEIQDVTKSADDKCTLEYVDSLSLGDAWNQCPGLPQILVDKKYQWTDMSYLGLVSTFRPIPADLTITNMRIDEVKLDQAEVSCQSAQMCFIRIPIVDFFLKGNLKIDSMFDQHPMVEVEDFVISLAEGETSPYIEFKVELNPSAGYGQMVQIPAEFIRVHLPEDSVVIFDKKFVEIDEKLLEQAYQDVLKEELEQLKKDIDVGKKINYSDFNQFKETIADKAYDRYLVMLFENAPPSYQLWGVLGFVLGNFLAGFPEIMEPVNTVLSEYLSSYYRDDITTRLNSIPILQEKFTQVLPKPVRLTSSEVRVKARETYNELNRYHGYLVHGREYLDILMNSLPRWGRTVSNSRFDDDDSDLVTSYNLDVKKVKSFFKSIDGAIEEDIHKQSKYVLNKVEAVIRSLSSLYSKYKGGGCPRYYISEIKKMTIELTDIVQNYNRTVTIHFAGFEADSINSNHQNNSISFAVEVCDLACDENSSLRYSSGVPFDPDTPHDIAMQIDIDMVNDYLRVLQKSGSLDFCVDKNNKVSFNCSHDVGYDEKLIRMGKPPYLAWDQATREYILKFPNLKGPSFLGTVAHRVEIPISLGVDDDPNKEIITAQPSREIVAESYIEFNNPLFLVPFLTVPSAVFSVIEYLIQNLVLQAQKSHLKSQINYGLPFMEDLNIKRFTGVDVGGGGGKLITFYAILE